MVSKEVLLPCQTSLWQQPYTGSRSTLDVVLPPPPHLLGAGLEGSPCLGMDFAQDHPLTRHLCSCQVCQSEMMLGPAEKLLLFPLTCRDAEKVETKKKILNLGVETPSLLQNPREQDFVPLTCPRQCSA